MDKYPEIAGACYIGSNVYVTPRKELTMVITRIGVVDIKVKQICFRPGTPDVFIVVD